MRPHVWWQAGQWRIGDRSMIVANHSGKTIEELRARMERCTWCCRTLLTYEKGD